MDRAEEGNITSLAKSQDDDDDDDDDAMSRHSAVTI
jgi:hypothetical protein